ncbi:SBBP repeat-containing protein [Hymenobacter volaticus]|uniref:SBBP repeat-containing protein n=1 Tax=Hymenobacter volaticus TaxID=2932254 RepID=A0ABY4GD48_9BACT|nr:SBBP repeat-containing protein [Hymenobacter volaticus]UOQ68763.1 SBBP repeat-containing protein [Hymenobacter volaticus]
MKQTFTRWLPLAAGLLFYVPVAQAQSRLPFSTSKAQPSLSQLPQPQLPVGAPALRHALPTTNGTLARAMPLRPTRPVVRRNESVTRARALASGSVSEQWVARFDNSNGNGYDGATAVATDATGNVYVTGYSFSNTSRYDYATVKYSPTGQQLWQVRYNGPTGGDDVAVGLTVDRIGNVYVTGYSYGTSATLYDYATVKYDGVSGQQLWASRYTGGAAGSMPSSQELASSLAVDAVGNVYVTGTAYGEGSSGCYYATVKYSAGGQLQWESRYSGPANTDVAAGLALDGVGNVYVTGTSYESTDSDYATIKVDATTGRQLWSARYNGPRKGYDLVRELAVDAAGNVAVTGTSEGDTSYDYATVKYTTNGQPVWQARYNGAGNSYDEATGVALDAAGNVAVTGYADTGNSNWDYVTIKYAAMTGQQTWAQAYNGAAGSYDEARDVVVDGAGNVAVTGRSFNASGRSDYATLKYAGATGQPLWQAQAPESTAGDATATSLAVDAAGNVAVTGSSVAVGSSVDYATFKYTAATGQPLWQARYTGPITEDQVRDLAVDAAGNVYVTGNRTVKYSANGQQLWTAPGGSHLVVSAAGNVYVTGAGTTRKYAASGQQLWEATTTAAESGYEAAGIGLDAAGNVYVSGNTLYLVSGNQYVTLKYEDATGQQLWDTRYRGSGFTRGNAVVDMAVDATGNVYVTGILNNPQNNWDYATLKYSSGGEQQWVSIFTGPLGFRDQQPSGIAVDASGNVYVTGSGIVTTFPVDIDYMTVKYSPTGEQSWVNYYNGGSGSNDIATDIAVDALGNVSVAGGSATIKYTASGSTLWVARNSESTITQVSRMAVDGSGNVYVTGSTSTDYATVKYAAATGQPVWDTRYNGPGNGADQATDLVVTSAGEVYVTGNSLGLNTGSDYATIHYVQTPEAAAPLVAATRAATGRNVQELSVYPNPMAAQATVSFRPHLDGEGQVRVYNQLGQEVARLYQGAVRKGQQYTLPLAGSSLLPGVYQCQLTVNGQREVVRLLVAH